MADESMVRNLAAQAEAIWPQEERLFDRYALPSAARILDVGCGTGEIASRLARKLPSATVMGVDLLESHLGLARERHAELAPRLSFEQGDAYALRWDDGAFDLALCRHVSQSIPDFHLVVAELARVVKPGGSIHLLAEDYLMLHLPARGARLDPDDFWSGIAMPFFQRTGTDGRSGRHAPTLMLEAGLADVSVDYVVVDSLRCGNDSLARILGSWRDGYVDIAAEVTGRAREEIRDRWDSMLDSLKDPNAYAVWHVPVVAGRKP